MAEARAFLQHLNDWDEERPASVPEARSHRGTRRRWTQLLLGSGATVLLLGLVVSLDRRPASSSLPSEARATPQEEEIHVVEESSRGRCVDEPVHWVSAGGVPCGDYAEARLCTRDGRAGPGWNAAALGSIEDWSLGGRSALQACCACGGGRRPPGATPAPTSHGLPASADGLPTGPPRPAVEEVRPSSGDALPRALPTQAIDDVVRTPADALPSAPPIDHPRDAGDAGSSNTTIGSMVPSATDTPDPGAPDPARVAGASAAEVTMDHDRCSWDFENCTGSRCCRGLGMQCYRKDETWAACRPSCVPGRDPFDTNGRPWSCEKLGPRTGSPGVDETCNPGRRGANVWNGKVFQQGSSETAANCSAECSSGSLCQTWAFLDPPRNRCLLRREDVRQPVGESCRIATYDMPSSNCSLSGHPCRHSRCCEEVGEQCYARDDAFAACMQTCRPSSGWSCEKLGPRVCPRCAPAARVRPVVVVPTFERDLCKAVILARSIAKRDPSGFLGDIFVLWVSTKPASQYAGQIEEMRQATLSSGVRGFRLLDFSGQVAQVNGTCVVWSFNGSACAVEMTGWHAQMALKLKIAEVIPTDYYLLLDSKNVFVSDVEEDTFLTPCNHGRVLGRCAYRDLPSPHDLWYARSAAALGIDAAEGFYWPTSITPALLHTATVLDLLRYIGEGTNPFKICDGPMCTMFGMQATEFTMYNLFAFSRRTRECIHAFGMSGNDVHSREWGVDLWRGALDNLKTCKSVEEAQAHVLPLTFGVQWGCLERMEHALAVLPPQQNTSGSSSILQRTSECITSVYRRAGVLEMSMDGERGLEACIS